MTNKERETVTRERLKRYQYIKQKIREAYADIEGGQLGGRSSGDVVQTSTHSDPTARGADMLLKLWTDERWIAAIDGALSELRENEPAIEQIVRRHFRIDYAKGYNRRHNGRTRYDLMGRYAISEREYYDRLDDGVRVVMIYAAERGLFIDCSKE